MGPAEVLSGKRLSCQQLSVPHERFPRALSTPTPNPNLFNFSNRLGLPPLLPSLVSAAIMEVPERVAKRVIINVKPGSKYREEA